MQKAILLVVVAVSIAAIIGTAAQTHAVKQHAAKVKQPKLTPTERFRSGYAQGWADAGLNTGNFCDNTIHTQTYCDGYSQGYYAYTDQHRHN